MTLNNTGDDANFERKLGADHGNHKRHMREELWE